MNKMYRESFLPTLTRITSLVLLLALSGCDQVIGLRNYDDCILKTMKGVNSDMAAKAIIFSCRNKFPGRKAEASQLPPEALRQLTGHASMGDFGYFYGNIYNGNRDWTVTQVTIRLIPKGKEKGAAAFLDAKEYNKDVSVPPLTSSSFLFTVDGPKQEYSWNIVGARGHK